ncbi:MAG: zinc-dependent metalloprotease family protein, partial [Methylocella sp.]
MASVAQNDLFVVVPEAMTALPAQQQTKLEQFRKERATAAVQVVKINANLLKAGPQLAPSRNLNLNFSTDKVFAAVATKIDQRSENDFTWHGNVPGKPSAVTLVVNGDNVTGSATIANEQLYTIEPLGSGLHAIIRKDPAKFPPEHPPGFEGIERSRKSLEPRRDQRGDDNGQVIRVLVAYTPAVAAAHSDIGSFVQLAVDESNTSYQNSQITPRLELAHSYQVNYTESGDFDTNLRRFRENNDGFMDEVHALRDAYTADVAVLIFNNNAACGLASDIIANA